MRSPLRVLALVGVLGSVVLAAIAIRGSFHMPLRSPAANSRAGGAEAPDDAVIQQALDLAIPDSTRRKTAWVDEIPDLDLAALPDPVRETFLRVANGRMCDCGCGYTLAGCRRYDSTCPVSGPRARALYDSVRTGRLASAGDHPKRPETR